MRRYKWAISHFVQRRLRRHGDRRCAQSPVISRLSSRYIQSASLRLHWELRQTNQTCCITCLENNNNNKKFSSMYSCNCVLLFPILWVFFFLYEDINDLLRYVSYTESSLRSDQPHTFPACALTYLGHTSAFSSAFLSAYTPSRHGQETAMSRYTGWTCPRTAWSAVSVICK